jgi:bifunctional non-homologous end joining protein LigD
VKSVATRQKRGADQSPPPATGRPPQLAEYEAKRDFSVTPEPPPGAVSGNAQPIFMIHKHHARRLHYDLRLELDAALASWAVPKGPSYDPAIKRLAVQTEDHPLEYGSFEGRIPDGEYGAGDSLIWDRGTYETVPPGQAAAMREKGHLHIELAGEKLKGRWHLVRTRGATGPKSNWILFKANDATANAARDIVVEEPGSVVSGRAVTRGPESRARMAAGGPPEALLEQVFAPMLATAVETPPADPREWIIELKYDGYRALSAVSRGRVAMWTRNRLDLTERFPHLQRALERITVGEAVIDAEIAALDASGAPRFARLQQGDTEAVLFAFDLLWLDGVDLRARPLQERRDLLTSVMSNLPTTLRLSERIDKGLSEALAETAARGCEGVILKRRGSSYVGGRSRDWLKIKVLRNQEVAIIGFAPASNNERHVGALLIAVADGGQLRFAGKVGTGFTTKQRAELMQLLEPDAIANSAVADAPRMRGVTWVAPRLVAQVRFAEWTDDRRMRHPSFLGLRIDKSPEETTPDPVAAVTATIPAERASEAPTVTLTNPTRIIYPRDGFTKTDVAAYYAAVAEPLLRAIADRPLTLQHWPKGIDGASFYHQHLDRKQPTWLRTVDTPARDDGRPVRHLVADRAEALRWLAQMSALTVHMWSARAGSLEQPDWVVFDLDPGDSGFAQTLAPAQALKRLFDQLSLPSVCKTTGKRGLHVLVPLLPGHTHDDAAAFALKIASAVAGVLPDVTLERSPKKRDGKLYLDCLQNGYGKTIVAPYSLRPLDGAPVSAPLAWSEVEPGLDPSAFNLRTMPERLRAVGDLFAPALSSGVRLPRLR